MRRFGLIVLTFVIVGPPCGFALLTGLSILQLGRLLLPMSVAFFLLISYIIGILPAFIAGLIVASLKNPGFWRVLIVGLVAGLVFALLIALLGAMPVNVHLMSGLLVIAIPICLVPTIVCWLVVRPLLLRISGPEATSPRVLADVFD